MLPVLHANAHGLEWDVQKAHMDAIRRSPDTVPLLWIKL